jgi:hypothetical protein
MTDIKRKKLETNIERQIHSLVSEIREHVVDFTVLKVRRSHPELDREQLAVVLEIVKHAIDDGFLTRVDRFMKKLDRSLEDFSDDFSGRVSEVSDVDLAVPVAKKPGRPESRKS